MSNTSLSALFKPGWKTLLRTQTSHLVWVTWRFDTRCHTIQPVNQSGCHTGKLFKQSNHHDATLGNYSTSQTVMMPHWETIPPVNQSWLRTGKLFHQWTSHDATLGNYSTSEPVTIPHWETIPQVNQPRCRTGKSFRDLPSSSPSQCTAGSSQRWRPCTASSPVGGGRSTFSWTNARAGGGRGSGCLPDWSVVLHSWRLGIGLHPGRLKRPKLCSVKQDIIWSGPLV